MFLNISACMRVRTTQNGFVIMLHVIPAIAADIAYSLYEPSFQPNYAFDLSLIDSYSGKYKVWKNGVQNSDIV